MPRTLGLHPIDGAPRDLVGPDMGPVIGQEIDAQVMQRARPGTVRPAPGAAGQDAKNGATAFGSPSTVRSEVKPSSISWEACSTVILWKVKGWFWL